MEEKVKASFLKPALIYGAILGGVGVLLGLILYFMNLSTETWVQWVSLVIGIAVLVYCLIAYRNEYLGGFASYGQILKMAVVIGIISAIIGTIYTYILHGVLDPDLVDKIRIAAEERIMNNPRIPESYYDQAMERVEKSLTLKKMVMNALIWGTVVNIILGLIISAFVKKEEKADIPV
jgi:ABC-type antimicrobial peptide transport system permease subunit